MVKRARLTSADQEEKLDAKQDEILDDLVSRLPDDILVNILTRLPLKEAGRTSVLSGRWKYLWAFIPSLWFDPARAVLSFVLGVPPTEEERSRRDSRVFYLQLSAGWIMRVLLFNFIKFKGCWFINTTEIRGCIFYCNNVKEIVISAPNLVYLKYVGPNVKLHVENVPKLFHVTVGGCKGVEPRNIIPPIISYFPQLTSLDLQFPVDKIYNQFPKCGFPKLRHLTLRVLPCTHERLVRLSYILKACPFLEKLALQLHEFMGGFRVMHPLTRYPLPYLHLIPMCPLQHLKELEFKEFGAFLKSDLGIASYVLGNTPKVEKVIVKRC